MSEPELYQRWLNEHVKPRLLALWKMHTEVNIVPLEYVGAVVPHAISPFVYWSREQLPPSLPAAVSASSQKPPGTLSPQQDDKFFADLAEEFDGVLEFDMDGSGKIVEVRISEYIGASGFSKLKSRLGIGWTYDQGRRAFVPARIMHGKK